MARKTQWLRDWRSSTPTWTGSACPAAGWLFDRRSGQLPIAKRTTAEPASTPAGRTITLIRA